MPLEISNQTKEETNEDLLRQAGLKFLSVHDLAGMSVSLALVDDQKMRTLNYQYRQQDKPTDVLSFGKQDGDWPSDNLLGELVIDIEQIRRQAEEYGHSFEYELVFILVHGLLHLLGYDDQTEKEARQMEDLGKQFIENYLKIKHG